MSGANPFALKGFAPSDSDEEPDEAPPAPPAAKPARAKPAAKPKPAGKGAGAGGRLGGGGGRDERAGVDPDEVGRGRGGRGGRQGQRGGGRGGSARRGRDRTSRTGRGDRLGREEKRGGAGKANWGTADDDKPLPAEDGGEAPGPEAEAEADPEAAEAPAPEDHSVSYEQYMKQQYEEQRKVLLEKAANLKKESGRAADDLAVAFKDAAKMEKADPEEENFLALSNTSQKSKRSKAKKTKQTLEARFCVADGAPAPRRDFERPSRGRGGGRGGRGGRGGGRGGARGGGRGGGRGGRMNVKIDDSSAFPTLG